MPFIQVTTREELPHEARAELAEALSTAMLDIEIGGPTDAALTRDWIWFETLPAGSWAVGGKLDASYVRGRTMCFARIIAPEGFLNKALKLEAITRVTDSIRSTLGSGPEDDGTGIWVHLVEVPEGQWGAAGTPDPLLVLIDGMKGHVSDKRRAEIEARFKGVAACREAFGIPE